MKLFVGCPVTRRNWILNKWHVHVLRSVEYLRRSTECELEYIFVVPSHDTETVATVAEFEVPVHIRLRDEHPIPDRRMWSSGRYTSMVETRNHLLDSVREFSPDYFLSLDSDILLAPEALQSALSVLTEDTWAVGLGAYMTPRGSGVTSMGVWLPNHNSYKRIDTDEVVRCDIIMAAKLMSPKAYNIDYEFHRNGEDLGWSLAVQRAGGKFLWDGRVKNKHVMEPGLLNVVDSRVGF